MSNRFHYDSHEQVTKLQETAAHAYLVASEGHGKQDHATGHERSRQALEHSHKTYEQNQQADREAHNEHGTSRLEHDDLAIIAHRLWEARGCPMGSPDEDWFQAAQELQLRPDRDE